MQAELPTQHRQRSPRLLQCPQKQRSTHKATKTALRIPRLGLPSKRERDPYTGHRKEIDQVGPSEGLDEIRILVTVRRELVVKADHARDRRRELGNAEGF